MMRLILAFSFLVVIVAAPVSAASAPRPHIVVIVADDLGRNDVGFMGGKEIKTPNLDRLAATGAQLDAFYVQPVCTPTRASLMTGRYPMRYGLQVGVIRPWATYGLPLDERILPQALQEAGYETAIVGKWHLGNHERAYLPTQRGFDHQYGHYFGALDYYTHIRDGKHDWHRNDQPSHDEGYTTHLLAREAVRRIHDRDARKPLFLYVPFNAVHAPHQLVLSNNHQKVELFNFKYAPNEQANLAEAQPGKMQELRQRYNALAKQAVPPKSPEGA